MREGKEERKSQKGRQSQRMRVIGETGEGMGFQDCRIQRGRERLRGRGIEMARNGGMEGKYGQRRGKGWIKEDRKD